MPKRNYGFEKRQKELAKQHKRAAKAQRRRDRSAPDDPTPETEPIDPSAPNEES